MAVRHSNIIIIIIGHDDGSFSPYLLPPTIITIKLHVLTKTFDALPRGTCSVNMFLGKFLGHVSLCHYPRCTMTRGSPTSLWKYFSSSKYFSNLGHNVSNHRTEWVERWRLLTLLTKIFLVTKNISLSLNSQCPLMDVTGNSLSEEEKMMSEADDDDDDD